MGDAILVCNQFDLRTMPHAEAVKCLSACGDELVLKVKNGEIKELDFKRITIAILYRLPSQHKPNLILMILQVAHIAGYDDEHHLEKAPILEIDPIPEERTRSQSIPKYQVRHQYHC